MYSYNPVELLYLNINQCLHSFKSLLCVGIDDTRIIHKTNSHRQIALKASYENRGYTKYQKFVATTFYLHGLMEGALRRALILARLHHTHSTSKALSSGGVQPSRV
jgi:uncharacterized protein (DUF1015 family)